MVQNQHFESWHRPTLGELLAARRPSRKIISIAGDIPTFQLIPNLPCQSLSVFFQRLNWFNTTTNP
jgi:hypothetical protein